MADLTVAAETCVALGATEHQSAIWLSSFCLSCEGCRDGFDQIRIGEAV